MNIRSAIVNTGLLVCAALLNSSGSDAQEQGYFHIQIVDEETGRGVPLVELRTVNHIRYVSDSHGNIAFFEPELMEQDTYFFVTAHGYQYPADGFGYRGKRLTPQIGKQAILKIQRINLAERLYRLTGAGIYRDSVLLHLPTPIQQPLMNAKVLGSDSVVNAVYRDELYWFWGDTNRAAYPLGLFDVPQARSDLAGGLSVEQGIDFHYEKNEEGFVTAAAAMPGDGPTWISGLMVVNRTSPASTVDDAARNECMLAMYVKVAQGMKVYERGLLQYDDEKKSFTKLKMYPLEQPIYPDGHVLHHQQDELAYLYFATPYPLVRVRASYDQVIDWNQYETYTCLSEGSRQGQEKIDRDEQGKLRYQWRKDVPIYNQELQNRLIAAELIKPEEALLQMKDIDTGKPIQLASGSVYWNEFRKCWIMIAVESFGKPSFLGEIWYAEATALTGPWHRCKKIVTHNDYSFYNPKQHPYFDQDGGRLIYFEGTYTREFSGTQQGTARYDYNQIMYRLDLADERLHRQTPQHQRD
jgi:hypothetical protein